MSLYETLITRTSVREFLDKPISKDIIEKIVYAGQRAATARNVQPWIFIGITNLETRKKLKNLCKQNAPFLDNAPVCIAVFCENTKYYLEDGCAATQNILNAAHSFGLGAVWVAGEKKEYADEVRKLLNVPDKYRLISLIPIGYPKKKPQLTSRKNLSEILFWENYK
ncbi:MAG TPA: nitroreductase family protein [bacterium]|nr:nitroreductase family protein [bacterium]HOL46991.1 nitroreductase family protein [bacterium]HPQ19013.1 nitroreductase family protein [bacterium]